MSEEELAFVLAYKSSGGKNSYSFAYSRDHLAATFDSVKRVESNTILGSIPFPPDKTEPVTAVCEEFRRTPSMTKADLEKRIQEL